MQTVIVDIKRLLYLLVSVSLSWSNKPYDIAPTNVNETFINTLSSSFIIYFSTFPLCRNCISLDSISYLLLFLFLSLPAKSRNQTKVIAHSFVFSAFNWHLRGLDTIHRLFSLEHKILMFQRESHSIKCSRDACKDPKWMNAMVINIIHLHIHTFISMNSWKFTVLFQNGIYGASIFIAVRWNRK